MFDPKTADSLMLAYLGDSVWELLVRERLFYTVPQGNTEANRLALEYVTASAQVKALEKIMPHLTEEEESVWRRGKNTKTNKPSSATITLWEITKETENCSILPFLQRLIVNFL